MGVLIAPVCFQSPHLNAFSSSFSFQKPFSVVSSYSLTTCRARQRALANSFVYQSPIFGSRNSQNYALNQACNANFNEFSPEELSNQIEELAQNFDLSHTDNDKGAVNAVSESENSINVGFSMPFSPSILEALEPSLLGIQPEPPQWPERDEIVNIGIQIKANSFDIPLSLRMIKKKQQGQMEFIEADEFAYCSIKKAFSSLVFIIGELQSHALTIRESLYSEDLEEIINNFQREMSASFVWLFQQVFSRTPALMVSVMILLANFTLHSMVDNAAIAVDPSPRMSCETITETVLETEENNQEQSKSSVSSEGNNGGDGKIRPLGNTTEDGNKYFRFQLPSQYPSNETSEVSWFGNDSLIREEELSLWNSVVEEALKMQAELRGEVLDHESMKQFVSPVTVEIEPDNYEVYHRTDLLYQMGLSQEPNNPLLLCNYAQFLHLITRDYNRAEECFKRAILLEPPDAEAMTRYADFLWTVRNDLWGAEEIYQRAMTTEPNNPYHASRYANFLWSTGGEETCFPLNTSHDNNNLVF